MLIEPPIPYLARKTSVTASGSICDYLFCFSEWCQWLTLLFCQHLLNGTIYPKLHLLEDHAADFMERQSTGHGIYVEQGTESIHKVFNISRRTCSSVQPSIKRLEIMMNKHFRLVHPETKSLKPEMKGNLTFS